MTNLRTDSPYQAGHYARDTDANLGLTKDAEGNVVVIDLGGHRRGDFDKLGEGSEGNISETYYGSLGAKIKLMLNAMFGGMFLPASIKGTQSEIEAFKKALLREKKYIESYVENGEDHPLTHKQKAILEGEVANFERVTSIKWPFV